MVKYYKSVQGNTVLKVIIWYRC